MATLFNNTEITNVFFNGTELDKIYFNGVLVFEKGGKYLRRIMVGDDLSARTIFQDFPDGFYKSGMSDGEQFNLIESNNINIYEYYIGGSYNVYCGNRTNSNLLYRYDLVFGRTMTKKDVTTGNYSNAIVTEVNENEAYRHCFIEDENIRPFEVGDIVLNTTKIYFSIPDNYFTDIWTSDDNKNDEIILIKEKGKEDVTYPYPSFVSSWTGGENFKLGAANLYEIGMNWLTNGELYNLDEGILIKNSSYINFSELKFNNFNINIGGEVFNVNKNHTAYPYILVDTRTLGTSGYKRRIQVGDNLDNRIIYFTFPDDFIPTTVGNVGYAFINGEESSFYEQPLSDNPIDTEIMISGMLLRIIYTASSPSEKITEIQTNSRDIGTINKIDDTNASYRHCFIEDNKIRPIQVGDKIIKGTKFYFNFPDNLYELLDKNLYEDDLFRAENLEGKTSLFIYDAEGIYKNDCASVTMQWEGLGSSTFEVPYQYNFVDNTVINNPSIFTLTTEYISSENNVISVNENSVLYPYVLVDITTLG